MVRRSQTIFEAYGHNRCLSMTIEGRALRLFQAGANLGNFDCSADLAHALLGEAADDSGLTPSEAQRKIDCGLAYGQRHPERGSK